MSTAAKRSTRKPNGIKGVRKEDRSNDALRDSLVSSLRASPNVEAFGPVEAKLCFAHTGIWLIGRLFGWVGEQFGIRTSNAAQREVAMAAGCKQAPNHKGSGPNSAHANYWVSALGERS